MTGTANERLISAEALKALSGYTRSADVERYCRSHGIRYFPGKRGPWTTAEALNAALGVRQPAATENPVEKIEF